MAPHSKTKFQEDWLEKVDKNSQVLKTWCQGTSNLYEAYCRVCQKTIACENGGVYQLFQHANGAKHKQKCASGLGNSQSRFSWRQPGLVAVTDAPRNQDAAVTSSTSSPIVQLRSQIRCIPVTKMDEKVKAEALWAMKIACCNFSFASSDFIGNLYAAMFPDSAIAKDFLMASTKASYIITYGLHPYFSKQLARSLEGAYFTIQFDETTTVQVQKQMDVLIRFWCSTTNQVQVRFLWAMMFGHAFADNVTTSLLAALSDLNLELRYLISISCDGPNVNKAIKQKMDKAVAEAGAKSLVDVGFCAIHIVRNSFRKGLLVFGLEAEEFCIDLFHHFKLSPARRDDFKHVQFDLGLDQDMFVRHVQS